MAAAARSLSPRLEALCAENEEIYDAVVRAGLFTTQDLGALGTDPDTVMKRLRINSPSARVEFHRIFSVARARTDGTDEARMRTMLDVLNSEGELIMRRPRSEVHRNGFWHRAVNVWVVCTSSSRVLLGQRPMSKDTDPDRWTCVCGRVPAGELSMTAAVDRLATELSIQAVPDEQISLIFTMKIPKQIAGGIFAGQTDAFFADVYLACLPEEIPVERLHLDMRAKQAAKYVTVDELQQAFADRNGAYIVPPNDEYCKKLLRYLRKACKPA